jgi:integrase
VVVAYLSALADGDVRVAWRAGRRHEQSYETRRPKRVSTIERAFAAISVMHQTRGYDWPHRHPAFVETLEGIRRTLGVARTKKTPIEVDRLAVCLAAHRPRTELATLRDRALCAVGFFAALRRSEAARLDVADVKFTPEGIIIEIRRGKTDQRGAGKQRAILYQRDVDVCAVRLLRAWLDASGITEGPVFRSVNKAGRLGARRLTGRAVGNVVKQIAEAGGLDPKACGGHSLRSGFATTAGRKGKSLHTIMAQGGWTNAQTALGYIRPAQLFRDNATEDLT